MTGDEFMKYMEGMIKGEPVMEALLKIEDPRLAMQVLCASLDTWCAKYNYNSCDLIDDMADAVHRVHEYEEDVDDEE